MYFLFLVAKQYIVNSNKQKVVVLMFSMYQLIYGLEEGSVNFLLPFELFRHLVEAESGIF